MPRHKREREAFVVYWLDIESDPSWNSSPDRPCLCTSVGFVLKRPRVANKKYPIPCWVFTSDWNDSGDSGATTIIPSSCVVDMVSLGMVSIHKRGQL